MRTTTQIDHLQHNETAPPQQAYSVDEFCTAWRICRATFYNLRKSGNGPRTLKIGARTIITVSANADFRERMERLSVESTTSRTNALDKTFSNTASGR